MNLSNVLDRSLQAHSLTPDIDLDAEPAALSVWLDPFSVAAVGSSPEPVVSGAVQELVVSPDLSLNLYGYPLLYYII